MASELNDNYDEDSLYCPGCGEYWTHCECMSLLALASDMMADSIAEDEANSLGEQQNGI